MAEVLNQAQTAPVAGPELYEARMQQRYARLDMLHLETGTTTYTFMPDRSERAYLMEQYKQGTLPGVSIRDGRFVLNHPSTQEA